MAKNFKLNIEKTLNSALFILQKLERGADFHKVFKILYFADQKHLATYGTPISGDLYVAMAHGPVPSKLYDIFKEVRDLAWLEKTYLNLFDITNNYIVIGKQQPNLEVLSESNIECLEASINENRALNFSQLTQKSHKTAWEAAANDEMSAIDIAREGGASEEMIKYIELNLENQIIFNTYAVAR